LAANSHLFTNQNMMVSQNSKSLPSHVHYPPVEPNPLPYNFLDPQYDINRYPPFKINTPTPFSLLAEAFDLVSQQKGQNS